MPPYPPPSQPPPSQPPPSHPPPPSTVAPHMYYPSSRAASSGAIDHAHTVAWGAPPTSCASLSTNVMPSQPFPGEGRTSGGGGGELRRFGGQTDLTKPWLQTSSGGHEQNLLSKGASTQVPASSSQVVLPFPLSYLSSTQPDRDPSSISRAAPSSTSAGFSFSLSGGPGMTSKPAATQSTSAAARPPPPPLTLPPGGFVFTGAPSTTSGPGIQADLRPQAPGTVFKFGSSTAPPVTHPAVNKPRPPVAHPALSKPLPNATSSQPFSFQTPSALSFPLQAGGMSLQLPSSATQPVVCKAATTSTPLLPVPATTVFSSPSPFIFGSSGLQGLTLSSLAPKPPPVKASQPTEEGKEKGGGGGGGGEAGDGGRKEDGSVSTTPSTSVPSGDEAEGRQVGNMLGETQGDRAVVAVSESFRGGGGEVRSASTNKAQGKTGTPTTTATSAASPVAAPEVPLSLKPPQLPPSSLSSSTLPPAGRAGGGGEKGQVLTPAPALQRAEVKGSAAADLQRTNPPPNPTAPHTSAPLPPLPAATTAVAASSKPALGSVSAAEVTPAVLTSTSQPTATTASDSKAPPLTLGSSQGQELDGSSPVEPAMEELDMEDDMAEGGAACPPALPPLSVCLSSCALSAPPCLH